MRIPKAASVALIMIGATMAPSAGNASTIFADFYQNACSSGLGCNGSGSSLIAEATIADVGSNVSITLHSFLSNFAFYEAGNPPVVAYMANPTGFTGPTGSPGSLGTWALDIPQGAQPPYNTGAPGQFDHGFGYGPGHNDIISVDLIFTLLGVSTGNFGFNSKNFIMAVDMCRVGTDGCAGTGFVGGVLSLTGHQGNTPLPAAVWLLGSVLASGAGFGAWRNRKAKRALVAA